MALFSPHFYKTPNTPSREIAASVANFLGTDNSEINIPSYKIYSDINNLPTVIASILNSVQNRAQFYPSQDNAERLGKNFSRYIHELKMTPFFVNSKLDHIGQTIESNDYNQLIDQIVSLYEGVDEIDRQTLKNLNTPKILIYHISLYLSHSEEGKSTITKQSYQLTRSVYDVIPSRIRENAGALTQLERKTVNDWLISNTSRPATTKTALCFPQQSYQAPTSGQFIALINYPLY